MCFTLLLGICMNRIFYFNIIYQCNANCVFCFSGSTKKAGRMMQADTIINSLTSVKPNKHDLVVLNGGEPTVHPEFYSILSRIQYMFPVGIAVYSNGISLINFKLLKDNNVFFVIPIHGSEIQHDNITQTKGSFKNTLNNISLLNANGYRYRIKFIINDLMISTDFCFADFLIKYELKPEEIIIARLNKTTKSQRNHVIIPTESQLVQYIQKQVNDLKHFNKIKFLDIPPCQLNDCNKIMADDDTPIFYFNDPDNAMQIRSYYKEVMIGADCVECKHYLECKTMKESYLTLSLSQNTFALERE